MAQICSWQGMRTMSALLLKERTRDDVATWKRRINGQGLDSEES